MVKKSIRKEILEKYFGKSKARRSIILSLHKVYPGKMYLTEIARDIGTQISAVGRAMSQDSPSARSLLKSGLIEKVNEGYTYFRLTEEGEEIARIILTKEEDMKENMVKRFINIESVLENNKEEAHGIHILR